MGFFSRFVSDSGLFRNDSSVFENVGMRGSRDDVMGSELVFPFSSFLRSFLFLNDATAGRLVRAATKVICCIVGDKIISIYLV